MHVADTDGNSSLLVFFRVNTSERSYSTDIYKEFYFYKQPVACFSLTSEALIVNRLEMVQMTAISIVGAVHRFHGSQQNGCTQAALPDVMLSFHFPTTCSSELI